MITKSIAIQRFLNHFTHPDLASLYSIDMECQVNVAQDGGIRIDDVFQGKRWHGWTDNITTWKSFRIPYKANTNPEYEDKEIKFDLAAHVEGIGMTGWDWKNKLSRWVAYDFDAIIGHSSKHPKKLTNEELEKVRQAAFDIPWVTIRKSTSGKGLHLYVFLEPIQTENHNEHSALARAILGQMSAIAGFNFQSHVDNCGGNMWVWHRKMLNTDGLTIIKQGSILPSSEIPANWKDHIKVVSGHKRRSLPQNIEEKNQENIFEELCGRHPHVPLDNEHKKLINYLREINAFWWWDQDHNMLVTHTKYLEQAYTDLGFKGYFKTNSPGTDLNQQNCFAFPVRRGAWSIRRYSPGIQEHDSWNQDAAGWTRCYLNREPNLHTVCRAYGALEDPSGGYIFREAEMAIEAARLLGININIDTALLSRETKLKEHKDGRIVALIERKDMDLADKMKGWLPKKKEWTQIFNAQLSAPMESEVGNYDDIVRHLVTESHEDYGWMIKTDSTWRLEPLAHLKVALASLGLNNKEITGVLGNNVFKAWTVVNKPFQPEYPGDREWNRKAAQLRFLPSQFNDTLKYEHWLKILNHCGSGLNDAIKQNGWCKANSILTGCDYLKCWISSLFKEPLEPLPYLFFFGPQNSGKSIFHEALSLLLTKGYRRVDAALVSQSMFNAELEGAIICVVEETDLRKNKQAYNRIKDWVTAREINIHAKNKTPYHVPNTTHYIHCANDHQACPIFPGDTRITMGYVEPIYETEMIPKRQLIMELEKEAPDFLSAILNLEVPVSNDRLNIPVITTEDKNMVAKLNQTMLQSFMDEKCKNINGSMIKFSEFVDKFHEWLEPNEIMNWSKIKIGRELPPQYPKARIRTTGHFFIGNIAWAQSEAEEGKKLIIVDDYLEEVQ